MIKGAFEEAGPYVFDNKMGGRARAEMMAEKRDFIWRHWKERRRGRLRASYVSKEGERSNVLYVVQEDPDRLWCIGIEVDSLLIDWKHSGHTYPQKRSFRAYSVERYEYPKGPGEKHTPIFETESRSPMSYRLLLKGKAGEVVREM